VNRAINGETRAQLQVCFSSYLCSRRAEEFTYQSELKVLKKRQFRTTPLFSLILQRLTHRTRQKVLSLSKYLYRVEKSTLAWIGITTWGLEEATETVREISTIILKKINNEIKSTSCWLLFFFDDFTAFEEVLLARKLQEYYHTKESILKWQRTHAKWSSRGWMDGWVGEGGDARWKYKRPSFVQFNWPFLCRLNWCATIGRMKFDVFLLEKTKILELLIRYRLWYNDSII